MHDARVAARRLVAAGDLYGSSVPEWERLRERLLKSVRRMGRVRNLDVALAFLSDGPAADRSARRSLGRALRRRRRKARRKLASWLDGGRVRRLREETDAYLRKVRRIRRREPLGPRELLPFFSRIMNLYADRAWTRDPEAAHEMRREVRWLRYAHETLERAYPVDDFRQARRVLRKVQELAGSWHDRCVLEELAARAVRKGKSDVSLDPLLARVRSESAGLVRRFVQATAVLIRLRPKMTGTAA